MPRPTPLAIKKLLDKPVRTLVSIGGVALAIVLMFMQLGFLGAVGSTATIIYRQMPMDIVVRSNDYLHLFEAGWIDERVLLPLRNLGEVAEIRVLDTSLASWQITEEIDQPSADRYRPQVARGIAVIGLEPHLPAVTTRELQRVLPRLTQADQILVDRQSRAEFGAKRGRFGPEDLGRRAELNAYSYRIVETFELGTGLAAAGAVITSREGFRRLRRGASTGRCSLVTIRLRDGVPVEEAVIRIQDRLKAIGQRGLQVTSAEDTLSQEKMRWYWETPIGLIFMMGVGVAVVVGGMICYMVLAGEVLAHLSEYATLKAIGYTDRFLIKILMQQAFFLAVLAFIPAFLLTILLYTLTSRLAEIPVEMTWARALIVALLSLVMCMGAGLVALRKLSKAEPANLF